MEMIEFTINGRKVKVSPKTTILQAAKQHGVYIPHLCYDPRLLPYGGCRLCVVEVEGVPKLRAACSTPVSKDIVVTTESEKLAKARRTVLELLLVHHPLDCPVCDKAGECELQDLAFKYGPSESRFKGHRKHDPEALAAPLVERNSNRCILCGKCVRVCKEHQGVGAISLIGRGFPTKVSPAFGATLNCEFCGQCIDSCPVGALGSKPFRHTARVWNMKDYENICPYCGCGCTFTMGIKEGRIMRSVGKLGAGINEGNLCGRGRYGLDFVHSDKRLTTPLIRKDGKLQPASWHEALSVVAGRLSEAREKHGAGAIGAIGSQRCSLEDNYMLQKFMRQTVGSPNIDSLARFGYARAQEAIKQAFGLNALPVAFAAPVEADAIFVVESDVTASHPVYGLNILTGVRENGAKLIVADPRQTKLARHASEWLRVKPATGVALMNGMMKVILDEGLADPASSQIPKSGDLAKSLEEYTPQKVSEITGVEAETIASAARTFAKAARKVLVLTMGDLENTKGKDTVLAAANLLMLTCAGAESLHIPAEYANTLGMFEAGIRPDAGPGHAALSEKGLDLNSMLYAEGSPIRALYVMGENPVASLPRLEAVEKALQGLDLLVVQDIVLSETAQRYAHVVLPALSWAEKDGTLIGMTGIPQKINRCLAPTGEAKADWLILNELSALMGKKTGPDSYAALEEEAKAESKLDFAITGAKASFNPVAYEAGEQVDKDYPIVMVTGVLLHHSGGLTTHSHSLGTVDADVYLKLNVADAERLGVKDGVYVKLLTRHGEEVLVKANVTDEVKEGTLFVPAHFPHARVNALTVPSSNGRPSTVAVKVEPAQ